MYHANLLALEVLHAMLSVDSIPCCRYGPIFIEKGGVPALISILALYRAPPFALRLAIAALASLVVSCGAAGCEAVLDWNNLEAPEEVADEDMVDGVADADPELAEARGRIDQDNDDDQVAASFPSWRATLI